MDSKEALDLLYRYAKCGLAHNMFCPKDARVWVDEVGKDMVDAERWRALLNSKRIRVLGTAGIGSSDYQHFGMEVWSDFTDEGDTDLVSYGKETLTKYVDAIIGVGKICLIKKRVIGGLNLRCFVKMFGNLLVMKLIESVYTTLIALI